MARGVLGCAACARPCSAADLCCDTCARRHRRCAGVPATAYPSGLFRCARCILTAAGVRPATVPAGALSLAGNLVALAGSSVAASSAVTYATARRRIVKFGSKELGLAEDAVLPRAPGLDLNPTVVCLWLAHDGRRLALSTWEGTISALADWQRSKGISGDRLISHGDGDPLFVPLVGRVRGTATPRAWFTPRLRGLLLQLAAHQERTVDVASYTAHSLRRGARRRPRWRWKTSGSRGVGARTLFWSTSRSQLGCGSR